jgi:alpha-ketoglutarate-dependent taurine dioxygenase
MPAATFVSEAATSPDASVAHTRLDKPLSYSGLLDSYTHSDLTTVIGTEYEGLQVVDLLSAKNSDALIRDLAVTISRRGVVFLRNQDVTPQQMRELMEKITELAGSVCRSPASDLNVSDFSFNSPNPLACTSTHSPRKEANSAIRSA